MTKKSVADHLPAKAPKKTGKRGIKPLDVDKDFHEAVKKEPQQAELLKVPAEKIPAISNGKMALHFVRFVPDRSKDRNRVVNLDFSLELEDEHAKKLPREILDAWKDLKSGNFKRVDPDGIGPQNLSLSLVPDAKADLDVVAAVTRATVSRITQKGKGKSRKITRLQMRFLTSFTDDVEHFCANAFDETVWGIIEESQQELNLNGDEEE